jgi:hypothetical protein
MNEIRLTETLEEISQNRNQQFQQMNKKIKEMSEEEKDLLYQKIIKEEEEVIRKQKRDTKIYNYLTNQIHFW